MKVSEYNTCVDSFSDNLFRFIIKNYKDEEKSKDVVQESYARLWVKVEEVAFEKAKSYLFTTAYRIMIDMIRREKKQGTFDEVDPSQHMHTNSYSDLNEILHTALEKLPTIQKSAILLRDYEGYSYEDIGKILDLTESQVKVYLYRARKFLKSYLGSIEKVLE